MNEPQKLWQSQPMETTRMSLAQIHERVEHLQAKGRLMAAASIVIGASLFLLFGGMVARSANSWPRLGSAVLAGWSLYMAYFAYRSQWPTPAAPGEASLDYYRRELERQRDLAQQVWQKTGLMWCFIGLGMIAIPGVIQGWGNRQMLLRMAPLFLLLATWGVLFVVLGRRKRRRLQEEIAQVAALRASDPHAGS